jgi:hypothetical protein
VRPDQDFQVYLAVYDLRKYKIREIRKTQRSKKTRARVQFATKSTEVNMSNLDNINAWIYPN